jgi:hypothetical protein
MLQKFCRESVNDKLFLIGIRVHAANEQSHMFPKELIQVGFTEFENRPLNHPFMDGTANNDRIIWVEVIAAAAGDPDQLHPFPQVLLQLGGTLFSTSQGGGVCD